MRGVILVCIQPTNPLLSSNLTQTGAHQLIPSFHFQPNQANEKHPAMSILSSKADKINTNKEHFWTNFLTSHKPAYINSPTTLLFESVIAVLTHHAMSRWSHSSNPVGVCWYTQKLILVMQTRNKTTCWYHFIHDRTLMFSGFYLFCIVFVLVFIYFLESRVQIASFEVLKLLKDSNKANTLFLKIVWALRMESYILKCKTQGC